MRRFDIEFTRGRRADTVEVLGADEDDARDFIADRYKGQNPLILSVEDVTDIEGLTDLTGVLNVPPDMLIDGAELGSGGAPAGLSASTRAPVRAGTFEEDTGAE